MHHANTKSEIAPLLLSIQIYCLEKIIEERYGRTIAFVLKKKFSSEDNDKRHSRLRVVR